MDGEAGPSSSSTHHHNSKLDLSNVNRGVWLVKVPKYIAARWEKIPGNVDAAKLKVVKRPGNAKPLVTLSLTDATLCLAEPGETSIPKEHELIVQSVSNQSLGVFSAEADPTTGKDVVKMEGKIGQRLECRPYADKNYLDLKIEEMKKVAQPVRQVIQLERPVNKFKPISNHEINIAYEEKKKAEGKKSRDDRDTVLEMLFKAFEQHQYYNLKDLVRITNQPVGYLKELLKDVCNYCVKNPHKNMWELKPEYRHYEVDKPEEKNDSDSD